MAVRLGQDDRDPQRDRRQRDRAGDVAAGAHHRVRAQASQQTTRTRQRQRGAQKSAQRAQRVRAAQPFNRDRVQLVTGRRHELGLGAAAADERDLGALSPQRVGHRERRHDVPRRPAGRDHDPLRFAHRSILPFRARVRRVSAWRWTAPRARAPSRRRRR